MIKGVNRQVIEIMDTGNLYYERALLVVRPEFAGAQREVLEREAKRMVSQMRAPSAIKRKHAFFYWALRLGLAALTGAGTMLLLALCNVI